MNWLAILISVIVYIGLGMLWHGPLFGKVWLRAIGMTPAKQKAMFKQMPKAYIATIVCCTLGAIVLQYVLVATGTVTVSGAMLLAAIVWLGLIVPAQVNAIIWEGRPWTLFWINALYSLVATALVAVILVSMP